MRSQKTNARRLSGLAGWLCRGVVVGLGLVILSAGCGRERVAPDGAPCTIAPCGDGGSQSDALPPHDRPPPEAPKQDCVVYPNGLPTIGIDMVPYSCTDSSWQPAACAAGVTEERPKLTGLHLCLPNPITYSDQPPTSGTHRGEWGRWGEYFFMPPQRWLHNLEHGGIAFLYHPCLPKPMIEQLRALARQRPNDPNAGPFRWILTPYPGLSTAIAVVAWGARYTAHCVNAAEINAFITKYYLKAPEDVPSDGSYAVMWIGR